MKKKLMMVAVLLGALSLGACVDDNESASVTDIRSAKAEQLRAVAALYQAKADAETAAAQAEADLKAAQAEYERAKAAAEQANADLAQERIRQLQEEFNYKIAALQAKWEAKVAYWNSLKAQYEGNLWENEDQNVQDAYERYSNALNQVYFLTENKMRQQVYRSQLEAEIITGEEALKQQINGLNVEKAQVERELAKLEAMKEAQPSKDEYLTMLDELEKQAYDILNNTATTALANETSKKNAYNTAAENLEKGNSYVVVGAIQDIQKVYQNLRSVGTTYVRPFVETTPVELAEDERNAFYQKYGLDPLGNFNVNAYEFVATTIDAATLEMNAAFEYTLGLKDDDIEKATGKAWEKDPQGNIIPGETGYMDDQGWHYTVNGVQGYIDYQNQLIDQEEKSIEDNTKLRDAEEVKGNEDGVEYYQGLIDASEENIGTLKGNIADAQVWKLDATAELNEAKEEKAEVEAWQKEYKEALAVLTKAENQKAYQDAVAALETPAAEYVEAQSATQDYKNQLADLGFKATTDGTVQPTGSGTYGDIKNVLNGINDVQGLIDDKNTRLAEIEAQIQLATSLGVQVTTYEIINTIYNPVTNTFEEVRVLVYQYTTNGDFTAEDALALVDANIANIDKKLQIQQALVEKYNKQLNDLLTNGESTDTPAEEETPAA